jgi:hypothetical protein
MRRRRRRIPRLAGRNNGSLPNLGETLFLRKPPNGKTNRMASQRASLGTNANRARSKDMNASSDWPRNRLLLALPSRNLKRLMPELEQIRCQRAQVLMNADSSLDHVFFPDSGVVSIGREGCSGVQAILGAKRSSVQLRPRRFGRRAVPLMPRRSA